MKNSTQLLEEKSKVRQYLFAFALLVTTLSFTRAHADDLVVAKDGSGNYTTVQEEGQTSSHWPLIN